MNDIAFRSATELAQMIRNGKMSSRELLDIYLQRIETHNPRINAVVTMDVEGARLQAKKADEMAAKGKFMGPLHGVPVTIKDGFETAGMRTTSGATIYENHIPRTHADAVQRYVDAGAVIMGKTNVPKFCADSQSYNTIFGTTNNPWDLERTPGGSSGGAVAALAAGLCGLEIGSDIAGSIRVPAAWTGVYGHRPTHGIVPFRGHVPPPPGILSEADLSVAGPLARSADDLQMALDLIAGPGQWNATAYRLSLPAPRARTLKEYRIAAWLDDAAMPVDDSVKACLAQMVAALRGAGARVDETARPAIDPADAFRTFMRLLSPVLAAGAPADLIELLKQVARTESEETELGQFARDATQMHRQWLSANAKRHGHRRIWADFFKDYDVLLCPVASLPAIVHDQKGEPIERTVMVNGKTEPYSILLRWAGLATYVYLPATSAPIGRTDGGLPVGVQIVGPFLEDRTPIDVAQKLAGIIGGFEPPPGYVP